MAFLSDQERHCYFVRSGGRPKGRRRQYAARPSLADSLRSANYRAQQRANRRIGKRKGATSIQATIANSIGIEEDLTLPQRILRWLGAALLIPVCMMMTMTLFQSVSQSDLMGQYWQSHSFFYFVIGLLLGTGWFFTRYFEKFFLYLYVLGHELTHALFILCCFGKISAFKVGVEGGYVMTNKSNLLIALSPYFVPFWSLLLGGIIGIISYFWPFTGDEAILYLVLGLTWGAHLIWTLWMIPRDQPDLKENGTLFSLTIIYLANLAIIAAMICITSSQLTFLKMASDFWQNALKIWHYIW